MLLEGRHEGTRINQKRFDQINEAKPEASS